MSSPPQPPTGTDAAKQRLRRFEWLVALLALVVLTLLYLFIPDRSASDLWEASLPNAIAALAIFFVILLYNQYLRRGPLEDVQELLDRQTDVIRQSVRPVGVISFFPDWSSISEADWRALLESAQRIDVVMNFSSSFLEKNSAGIEAAAKAGAKVNLYLPDPGNPAANAPMDESERERLSDLARAYEISIPTLQERIAGSVKMARSLAAPSQVSVRFFSRLMYAAVRIDKQTLVLSHYDQFPVVHAKASAVVLDLRASDALKEYWRGQFSGLDGQAAQANPALDNLTAHF